MMVPTGRPGKNHHAANPHARFPQCRDAVSQGGAGGEYVVDHDGGFRQYGARPNRKPSART
jgi:hypothetical protein